MMGKIVVILLAVTFSGLVLTSPTIPVNQPDNQAFVVKFKNNSNETGTYSVIYELSNGIIHSESGSLSNGINDETEDAQGSYWFMGPDNVTYMISYLFTEDGFVVLGPPTGAAFNKALVSLVG